VKKRILCDMDGIITDLLHKWLAAYNKDYPHFKQLNKHDITTYNYSDVCPIGSSMDDYIHRPGFFIDLPPISGAIETLNLLHKEGFEIYITTAPSDFPGSAAEKMWWLKKHLSFINRNNTIIVRDKHLVKGDIFIDDSPDKLMAYKKEWPNAELITIEYPFNKCIEDQVHLYAKDYNDTINAWTEIYQYLTN